MDYTISSQSIYPTEIIIEKMPQGCVLHKGNNTMLISSPEDAMNISSALMEMIAVQFPHVYHKINFV